MVVVDQLDPASNTRRRFTNVVPDGVGVRLRSVPLVTQVPAGLGLTDNRQVQGLRQSGAHGSKPRI
jgi:hypothetical protein